MAVSAARVFAGECATGKHSRLFPSPAAAITAFSCAISGLASFCTEADGVLSSRVKIFDRDLKRKQRDRAAWLMGGKNDFVDSVAENLLDRLEAGCCSYRRFLSCFPWQTSLDREEIPAVISLILCCFPSLEY